MAERNLPMVYDLIEGLREQGHVFIMVLVRGNCSRLRSVSGDENKRQMMKVAVYGTVTCRVSFGSLTKDH